LSDTAAPPRAGAGPLSRVEVPPTADVEGIVRAAGGLPSRALYADGVLSVRGVEQEALEAAAAGADAMFGPRRVKKAVAQAELIRRIDAGMPWGGRVLQIDEASQQRITSVALTAAMGPLPDPFAWRMADNSSLPMGGADVVAMARSAMSYVAALRSHYWVLVDAVEAAPDAGALAAIDVEADWPEPPPDGFVPAE
jgi:Domain of unknown function (DUF4376)